MMKHNVEWDEFKISDIFNIYNGKGLTKKEIEDNLGDVPVIQGGEANQGCIGYIDNNYCNEKKYLIIEKPCLTLARVGTAGIVHYWSSKCAIGDKCKALISKEDISNSCYLFLSTILNCLKYKYDYGRGVVTETYLQEIIRLPINEMGKPNWNYMNDYIKTFKYKTLLTNNELPKNKIEKEIIDWKEYKLSDIFDIKKGKRLTSADQTEGDNIYIGAIDSNNGVANYIGQDPIYSGNTITLSYNGSVGEAFYQPKPFWATDDVNVLYFKKENGYKFNKYLGMFISTILRQEKYKFSYGRKWTLDNMNETVIKLPSIKIDDKYIPNWRWMENYIKLLPYGDRI